MKRIFSCAIIMLAALSALSQTKNNAVFNLSGTWVLDLKASSLSSKDELKEYIVFIEHSEPVLRITRKITLNDRIQAYRETFYTDKRGEVNNTKILDQNYDDKSKTFWKKDSLLIKSELKIKFKGGESINSKTQKFTLSADKNTLTCEVERHLGFVASDDITANIGTPPTYDKYVFRRKDN